MPDTQNTVPSIELYLPEVGIENLLLPFKLEMATGQIIDTITEVSVRVDLNSNIRGISMSRLPLVLQHFTHNRIKHTMMRHILATVMKELGSENAIIDFKFKLPIDKKSLVSEFYFPEFYDCRFIGIIKDLYFSFYEEVTIQYISYCSCSADLCKTIEGNGYPHNQRSFAKALIKIDLPLGTVWLEELISIIEDCLVTIPYPIIKRIDELSMAKLAVRNTQFVEDAVRKISIALNDNWRISDWIVKCIHEESIHKHNAVALNYKNIKNGLRNFI